MSRVKVLALDIEGTLISNAMSQIPRGGLRGFLEECAELVPRIVIFTAVRREKLQEIADRLVTERLAPEWFSQLEYIEWKGKQKNLSFISGARPDEIVLIDDFEDYIDPSQREQWIPIRCFEHPYDDDDELKRVAEVLRERTTEAK